MMTDAKLPFDAITTNRYATESRLILESFAVPESYNTQIINSIFRIRRAYTIAVALTKVVSNMCLDHLLKHDTCDHPIEQCIVLVVY